MKSLAVILALLGGLVPVGRIAPSQAKLAEVLARTTRVRIVSIAPADGGNVLLDTSAPEHLADLRRYLAIVEDPSYFHCMCMGTERFELYEGDLQIAFIGLHHGESIRWTNVWESDALLADPEGMVRWLARVGVEGPLREAERASTGAARYRAQRADWLRAMPSSLAPFRGALDDAVPGQPLRGAEVMIAALRAEHPAPGAAIRALFAWFGSGAGPWDGFPSYEAGPEALLLVHDTRALLSALEGRTLSDAEAQGAARLFGGYSFRRDRPEDARLLPPALRAVLLEAGLRTTDADRIEQARAAFGER